MVTSNLTPSPTGGPLRSVVEYPLPRSKLVIALQGEPPAWVEPTLLALGRLMMLQPNWDSYGARAVDAGCVWDALQLLTRALSDASPTPAVVPTNKGWVQLEWHTGGIDLEIEVLAPGRYSVFAEDAATGETWEGNTDDVGQLKRWIGRLAPHRGNGAPSAEDR